MTCRSNAPDPTLNLAFQSLVIRGMSGYARLKVRGLLTKSNRKKFLQRPMKATKRTATSLTFPFALFAFLNMALAADNRLPGRRAPYIGSRRAAISARRGACQSVRGSPAKSLCCQNVPKAQGVRPTFQTAFFKTTFASSSPPTPATQSGLYQPTRKRLRGDALQRIVDDPGRTDPSCVSLTPQLKRE